MSKEIQLLIFEEDELSGKGMFFKNPTGALVYFLRFFQRSKRHAARLTAEAAKKLLEGEENRG